jgi:superfamily II DNA or RNA helicase
MSIEEYRRFIASKATQAQMDGFAPYAMNAHMKAHQAEAVDFALRRGSAALFLDTGLGKSLCELEWARQIVQRTGQPVLILTPLAVAAQMVREGTKFGIDACQIRDQSEVVGSGVYVANYERLPKLDASVFGGVVLDESSILKSFAGRTRNTLMDAFKKCSFKLAATATPSPNDHMELGNHAEFLGVMRQQEMLSKWFINDTSTASQEWRLKGHAVEDFWSWVASWSRCATLPSDLGGDDAGYVLPEIDRRIHEVQADRQQDTQGMLFRIPELSATSFHAEKRLTMQARCERAAELATHDKPVTVWCETNDESSALAKMIPGAREVRGDMKPEEKEALLLGFADGDFRVMVTKPKLAGFGLNWQHCAHAVFASISFSYEQHYQAVRRSYRFGQTGQVRNDIVIADTEAAIWHTIHGKAEKHAEMKRRMAEAMKRAQRNSETRVKYDRPLELAFPDWIKEEEG